MSFKHTIRNSVVFLTWIPVGYVFLNHVAQPCSITGTSMTPTLNPGLELTTNDLVLVKKWGFKRPHSVHRGDIIMFRSPYDPEKLVTKRVVAVQGDTVYPKHPYPKSSTRIPRNHVWVEGDNAFHSIDSNDYGPISQGLIVGKVVSVLWPLNRFGTDLSQGGRDPRIQLPEQ